MDPEELARPLQGAAGAAPLPRLHGRPGPGRLPGRRRGLRRQGRQHLEGRADAAPSCWTACARCPGFGEQKAKIFAALLGKQLGVRPEGWREATAPYGEDGSYLSVADITDAESLLKVRATKKAMKAKAKAKAHRGGVTAGTTSRRAASTSARPDRPGPGRLRGDCIAGGVDVVQLRDKHLDARPLLGPGPPGRRPCAASTACPSCSTTGPTWRSRRGPTGSTWARTMPRLRWPAASWAPTPSSACPPTRRPSSRRAATEDVDLHLGRTGGGHADQARPSGTGLDYVSLASARSSVPVFVTGGVTPETIPALAAPESATSWWCAT